VRDGSSHFGPVLAVGVLAERRLCRLSTVPSDSPRCTVHRWAVGEASGYDDAEGIASCRTSASGSGVLPRDEGESRNHPTRHSCPLPQLITAGPGRSCGSDRLRRGESEYGSVSRFRVLIAWSKSVVRQRWKLWDSRTGAFRDRGRAGSVCRLAVPERACISLVIDARGVKRARVHCREQRWVENQR
jgi:hypothetical protein